MLNKDKLLLRLSRNSPATLSKVRITVGPRYEAAGCDRGQLILFVGVATSESRYATLKADLNEGYWWNGASPKCCIALVSRIDTIP